MLSTSEYNRTLANFRDDLRVPAITFGRCAFTGEWGKVVTLDLGDICVQVPDAKKGVFTDEDGEIGFSIFKPQTFSSQVTLSETGLEHLLEYMRSQDTPIPTVTPHLVYQWHVFYTDGTALSQFTNDSATGEEIETNSKEIDFSRLAQISVVPRPEEDQSLPRFTLVKETGIIFRNGEALDTHWDGIYDAQSMDICYARKVTINYGAAPIMSSLNRKLSASSSVLQLLGFKVGGIAGNGPGLLIAIDEKGGWMPWYSEE